MPERRPGTRPGTLVSTLFGDSTSSGPGHSRGSCLGPPATVDHSQTTYVSSSTPHSSNPSRRPYSPRHRLWFSPNRGGPSWSQRPKDQEERLPTSETLVPWGKTESLERIPHLCRWSGDLSPELRRDRTRGPEDRRTTDDGLQSDLPDPGAQIQVRGSPGSGRGTSPIPDRPDPFPSLYVVLQYPGSSDPP